MPLPKNTELVGTNNNKYKIIKTLGQGGFGIVYEASNTQGVKVAIKEYFPNSLATRIQGSLEVNPNTYAPEAKGLFDSQKKRFRQEAEHMKRFNDDPRIVDVFDSFDANGTAYIVMEFIKGNTLAQVMSNWPNHRIPLDNLINDLEPIVDVLEKLHKINLIHRDISPYNIMFSAKTTKLLDFGAARIVAPGGHTLTNIVNKHYSPPEQFLEVDAEKHQGTWSDVYALAATIYHAITGQLAPHANERQYAFITGKDILKPPSAFGITISKQQEQALLKGLALNYQDRYQTVREFFDDLKDKTQKKICPDCGREYDANFSECPYEDCPSHQTNPPQTKKLCPYCKRYYDSSLSKCDKPDCPGNKTQIDKRPWIAAACAILVAVASFGYMSSSQNKLDEFTKEAKELKSQTSKYDYINTNFGYGSAAYYADIPVLVLNKGGAKGNIPIYWSSWDNPQTTELDANISKPDALQIEWADEVTNQRRNAIVTSGSDAGAYIVHFSNEKDNDAFDVLVVVKE